MDFRKKDFSCRINFLLPCSFRFMAIIVSNLDFEDYKSWCWNSNQLFDYLDFIKLIGTIIIGEVRSLHSFVKEFEYDLFKTFNINKKLIFILI
jgi:hypothetical protein